MKLKRNDLQELGKTELVVVTKKLVEAKRELSLSSLERKRGKLKNLRTGKITRRSIAQLKTLARKLSVHQKAT